MLKTTYTENGYYLNYLNESLSDWLNTRYLVYLRATVSIYVHKNAIASIMLPRNLFHISLLKALQAESQNVYEITICDEEFIEVSLKGIWLANHEVSDEGIFVCDLGNRVESCIYQIWQESQLGVSVLGE
ncbi:alr0857 family protein [Myxosarcina sp. GI1]|uniref:alr0857 family protein n=1 Tax=Myxosarcina sp. GI1 TaxID=1541065 RepID=UPI000566B2B2|nr:alr0857 family protein [Myxosarcina sp. GI1]